MSRSTQRPAQPHSTAVAIGLTPLFVVASLVVAASVAGCGPQSPTDGRQGSVATGSVDRAAAPETPPDSTGKAQAPTKPAGWPAGDDPAAALVELGETIKQRFTDFQVISKQIYPPGWTKLRYRPEGITPAVTASDAQGKPRQAVVRIKYQKLSSVIQSTEEAARAGEDLLPYPAAETREAMTGRLFSKPWPPIEAEIVYELRDGRWIRVEFKTPAVGREGADWLDRVGVP